jgi:ribosomal protein S18 acetylase RimI-like enzyme
MSEGRTLDFTIREATADDRAAIAAINRQAWPGGITTHELLEQRHGRLNDIPWSESIANAVSGHLARPDVTTFVAEHEGAVIGYAAAQIDAAQHADMGTISYNAVAPEFQGHGVGSALIQQVVDYLVAQGARVLTVVTVEEDTPALRIYERLGFHKLTSLIYLSRDVPSEESGS